MRRHAGRLVIWVVVMVAATAACGGGGSDDGDGDAAATTATTADGPTTTKAAGADLPQFASDFDRVCTTQVGFKGAKAYEPTPGVHPTIFFEEYESDSYVASSRSLPDGWLVKEDTDFEDNTELKAVQLIACSDMVKETPTGKKCDFEDDGKKTTLELVDATYELTIYSALSGAQVAKTTLEAKDSECPMFATFKEGDTTYTNEPTDDAYINALKPTVAPA